MLTPSSKVAALELSLGASRPDCRELYSDLVQVEEAVGCFRMWELHLEGFRGGHGRRGGPGPVLLSVCLQEQLQMEGCSLTLRKPSQGYLLIERMCFSRPAVKFRGQQPSRSTSVLPTRDGDWASSGQTRSPGAPGGAAVGHPLKLGSFRRLLLDPGGLWKVLGGAGSPTSASAVGGRRRGPLFAAGRATAPATGHDRSPASSSVLQPRQGCLGGTPPPPQNPCLQAFQSLS